MWVGYSSRSVKVLRANVAKHPTTAAMIKSAVRAVAKAVGRVLRTVPLKYPESAYAVLQANAPIRSATANLA